VPINRSMSLDRRRVGWPARQFLLSFRVGAVSTPRSAAMSSLPQIGTGEDQQPVGGIDVSGLLATLSCAMGCLGGVTDGHDWLLMQTSAPTQLGRCTRLKTETFGISNSGRVDFFAEILGHEIQQRGAQFDDLLVGEALALELAVEALCYGLVSVQVQLFRMFVGHVHFRVRALCLSSSKQGSCQLYDLAPVGRTRVERWINLVPQVRS